MNKKCVFEADTWKRVVGDGGHVSARHDDSALVVMTCEKKKVLVRAARDATLQCWTLVGVFLSSPSDVTARSSQETCR
ncbi:hypothetical protein E2C01_037973 [Portunus trituberculatus]|uniref:Uncharacterized protein n=1 Tax=Portunus trituberculatus TaxID=210409 RepID=A0A5B7FAY7_PORTR|nr:hypothetical protein [Portunus trituberculatus]